MKQFEKLMQEAIELGMKKYDEVMEEANEKYNEALEIRKHVKELEKLAPKGAEEFEKLDDFQKDIVMAMFTGVVNNAKKHMGVL
jgi:tRNA uridine 5-carbamoylmethylation protein Kti12